MAGLEQLRCLVSFIDNELKAKQRNLRNNPRQALSFADLALLFSSGDTVISKDYKQAYLVVNVTCARHRVKNLKVTSTNFWKDKGQVEFEDNPIHIHCAHIDFDGKLLGPVPSVFTISRFEGEKKVTSLPILPFNYAKEDGRRERLTERGKAFFKVAGIRHMHYKGLTLKTRDEVDSQVVVDFDEAINRHPKWKPSIKSLVEEAPSEGAEPKEPVPKSPGESLSPPSSPPSPPSPPKRSQRRYGVERETAWYPPRIGQYEKPFFTRLRLKSPRWCVDECCETEAPHYDEYVESWIREDFIASQLNETPSATPPVSIIPRDFREIEENNTLTDEEYLIMSFRVFGFVLRSRKWRMYLNHADLALALLTQIRNR